MSHAPKSLLRPALSGGKLILAAPLLFTACQVVEQEVTVEDLYREGQYKEASELAAEKAEANPDDGHAAAVQLMAEVAVLLEEGRQASYAGDNPAALDAFFRADEILPDHPVVLEWIEKVVGELATETLRAAGEQAGLGNLEAAMVLYERVLTFDPDSDAAHAGISWALLLANHHAGLGEDYYRAGMRALRGYWLGQANADFEYTLKYAPEDERGVVRRDEVAELLADDRVLMAQGFEEKGLLSAARNEYRIALIIFPEHEEAAGGFERLDREVAAANKLREAQRKTTRGELDAAEEFLREGVKMTQSQRDEFRDAYNEVEEARWERLYEQGKDFELASEFEAAVATYDELLQETGYYEDALTRRKTCRGFIELAERLYGEASAAAGPDKRLRKLRQIAVFWPEYKDVKQKLAELE